MSLKSHPNLRKILLENEKLKILAHRVRGKMYLHKIKDKAHIIASPRYNFAYKIDTKPPRLLLLNRGHCKSFRYLVLSS